MTTQIGQLPQLFGGFAADGVTYLPARFAVVTNADWRDVLPFVQPVPNSTQPLDITGIAFRGQLRGGNDNQTVLASFSTDDQTLVNGGVSGLLSFAIPLAQTAAFQIGPAVMDILAIADGQTINLFQRAGPAQVQVAAGVTQ